MIVSKTIDAYVKAMGDSGHPMTFDEIVAVTPGFNGIRFLKARGLIRDTGRGYRSANARYTGPRLPGFVLTKAGNDLYDSIKMEEILLPVAVRFTESHLRESAARNKVLISWLDSPKRRQP